jgi:hypothetical protein
MLLIVKLKPNNGTSIVLSIKMNNSRGNDNNRKARRVAFSEAHSQRVSRFLITDSVSLYFLGTFRFLFLVEYLKRQHNIQQVIFVKEKWDAKDEFCRIWGFHTNDEDHYMGMSLNRLLQREVRNNTTIVILSAYPERLVFPELPYIEWFLYINSEYANKALREDVRYVNYDLIPGVLLPRLLPPPYPYPILEPSLLLRPPVICADKTSREHISIPFSSPISQ